MTDINSNTEPNMTDDKFVAEVEEGVIADSSPETKRPATTKILSLVSRKYDIDGDGVLDEAELKMRNLDKSGRGHLTNETVYALMQEQLSMQRSIFQMKRVIVGLIAFTVILALANLGTSFASAILAKDTKTSDGQLVDKKTNEAVETAAAAEIFTVGADDGENARKLAECTSTVSTDCESTVTTPTTMSSANALALLKNCKAGTKNVQLQLKSGSTVTQVPVCGPNFTCGTSQYTMNRQGTAPIAGDLCIPGSTERLLVTKAGSAYTLSKNMFAPATTTLAQGAKCKADADCSSNECSFPMFAAVMPMPCATASDCDNGSTTSLLCYQDICSPCNSTSCPSGQTCAVPACGGGQTCHVREDACYGTCM